MKTPALFPQPPTDEPRLSAALSRGEYRAAGNRPKWTRRSLSSRIDCQECGALQAETFGAYWPRRQARHRRRVNGTTLDLCHAHTLAWKQRDADDGVSP